MHEGKLMQNSVVSMIKSSLLNILKVCVCGDWYKLNTMCPWFDYIIYSKQWLPPPHPPILLGLNYNPKSTIHLFKITQENNLFGSFVQE